MVHSVHFQITHSKAHLWLCETQVHNINRLHTIPTKTSIIASSSKHSTISSPFIYSKFYFPFYIPNSGQWRIHCSPDRYCVLLLWADILLFELFIASNLRLHLSSNMSSLTDSEEGAPYHKLLSYILSLLWDLLTSWIIRGGGSKRKGTIKESNHTVMEGLQKMY